MASAEPSPSWLLERFAGTAAEFHARPVPEPAKRSLWWFEVDGPTVVLGSTQPWSDVDRVRADAAGVAVARRRSGGGAVWLDSGVVTWVDVVLPADDHRWTDDVSRATDWLGEAWVRSLVAVGVSGTVSHHGPMQTSRWSSLVCFGGLGPGEVTIDGAKVVGISQRRTRGWARFQCALLHHWDPAPLLGMLDLTDEERGQAMDDLRAAGHGVGSISPQAVVSALVAELGLN